jgi:thymidylate kinase
MNAGAGNRQTRLISFSGIDGAGKSTQIQALRSRIQEAGLRVLLITFWDDVARLTRLREVTGHTLFKGDKGVGTPAAPIVRRDKNVRSRLMTVVRLGLYFLDAVSLRIVIQRALRTPADLVICDRYIYDELANLAVRNPVIRLYVRLLLKLVPRPHIIYLLDADPVQAFARKPEYPLEFLHLSRESYLTLSDVVGGMTILSPMPAEDVERQVLRHASTLLSVNGSVNEHARESWAGGGAGDADGQLGNPEIDGSPTV